MWPKPTKPKSKTAPKNTRAAATNKRGSGRDQDLAPYLPHIPDLPLRKYGRWVQRSIKEDEIPDHVLVGDISKGKKHPAPNPHRGDIDDQFETYMFTKPNYSPIKLINSEIIYRDNLEVSCKFINIFTISLNNIVL